MLAFKDSQGMRKTLRAPATVLLRFRKLNLRLKPQRRAIEQRGMTKRPFV